MEKMKFLAAAHGLLDREIKRVNSWFPAGQRPVGNREETGASGPIDEIGAGLPAQNADDTNLV